MPKRAHEDKDRELLLLGIIRSGDIHVYELNKFIDAHGPGLISLKKSTIYNTLRRMEKDGWIDSYEQQVANHPPRRMYRIQPPGEALFQQLLRERGSTFVIPELLGAISLGFLHELPLEEAARLLRQRREAAVKTAALFDHDHALVPQVLSHPLLGADVVYLQQFFKQEVAFLDMLLTRIAEHSP